MRLTNCFHRTRYEATYFATSMLTKLLKLALVATLIGVVAYSIQWRDELSWVDARGNIEKTQTGKIIGAWDGPDIEWRADGGETAEVLTLSDPVSPITIDVSPGFFTYWRNLDVLYFSLGALLFLIGQMVAATRWWWILQVSNIPAPFLTAVRLSWIGVFFNNVVPGQTGGDVVKAVMIARRSPGAKVRALLSVFVDRLLGLLSLSLLAAGAVLFAMDRFLPIAITIWAFIAIGAVCAVLFLRDSENDNGLLARLFRRLPSRFQSAHAQILQAIKLYAKQWKGILLWLVVGIANHGLFVSTAWLFGVALGVGLPALEYFILVPVIFIVSAIPIAPAGWGVGEALFGKLFATYGAIYVQSADPATTMFTRGVTVSILYRLNATFWSLAGGLCLLFDRADHITSKSDQDSKLE